MDTSVLTTWRWLVSPPGERLLAHAAELGGDPLSLSTTLRKLATPEQVRLVVEQVELRRRAATKFTRAVDMFFLPVALEQATDEWIAGYKASRFPAGAAVADLCCGVGGDLIALAKRGLATGVDRDELTAFVARANLESLGISLGSVVAKSAAQVDMKEFKAWHIDPDRRGMGRRTTHADYCDPPAGEIEPMIAACESAAIKLAPAAEPPDAWLKRSELEWISRAGECRQLVAWFGSLAKEPGQRRATMLLGGDKTRTVRESPNAAGHVAPGLGCYLYEPDPAVIAARLTASLAAEHDLAAVAPGVAYLTGDVRTDDPALTGFKILATLPYHAKRVQALLAERGLTRLEIKKRGVDLDPERVRKELAPERGASSQRRADCDRQFDATVILYRNGKQVLAVVAQRLAKHDDLTGGVSS